MLFIRKELGNDCVRDSVNDIEDICKVDVSKVRVCVWTWRCGFIQCSWFKEDHVNQLVLPLGNQRSPCQYAPVSHLLSSWDHIHAVGTGRGDTYPWSSGPTSSSYWSWGYHK